MTWNPLKKTCLNSRPSSLTELLNRNDEKHLELIFLKLQHNEDVSKRLIKLMKKQMNGLQNVVKAEQKITSDLSASNLCHKDDNLRTLVEEYHTVTSKVNDNIQNVNKLNQNCVIEPLKKYAALFSCIDEAFHKRELLLNECKNHFTKIKKIQDKEKTGSNIAKLEKERRALEQSLEELTKFHQNMITELSQFLEKRDDYIQLSLQGLVNSQLDIHGQALSLYTHLVPIAGSAKASPSAQIPEAEFQASIQAKFSKIRSLSIIKPPHPRS